MEIVELVGYIASILVAVSLTMNKILRLRVINTLGAIAFSLYGFFLTAYPVLIVNAFIVLINIYYLVKMFRNKDQFDVLPSEITSDYLNSFYKHYSKDIHNFFTDFEFETLKDCELIFILRNLRPVNLVAFKRQENNIVDIKLDYTIPEYRDFLNAKYLLSIFKEIAKDQKLQLVSKSSSSAHSKYLQKIGFIKNDMGLFVKKI